MYLNPSYTVSSQSRPFRNNTAQWLAGAAVIKDHRPGWGGELTQQTFIVSWFQRPEV